MSTYSLDSVSQTLTASTVYTPTASGSGFNYLEVVNVDGSSQVTYVVGKGSAPSDPTVGMADAWVLPAAVGAARVHDLDPTSATHVKVISAGTPTVRVTVW